MYLLRLRNGLLGGLLLLSGFPASAAEVLKLYGPGGPAPAMKEDARIDAWLIWNIWQISNAQLADWVEVEEPWRIYRSSDIVLTQRGHDKPAAIQFVEFLKSDEGRAIFSKWGWQG